MLALACAIDALRSANVECGRIAYKLQLLHADPHGSTGEVSSSSAIPIPTELIATNDSFDVIAVCGGERSHDYFSKNLDRWLRQFASRSTIIGSISDGAFVVAKSGLFDKCRSTIHWKCLDAYRERHPQFDIRASIMELDGNRFSCAGGTASLDLMLNFILRDLGPEIVTRIADNYFHDTVREESQAQHLATAFRLAGRNPLLSKCLLMMENNLEKPFSIAKMAKTLGTSHRQLDRLFNKHLKTSPAEYYRLLRLARGASLLLQTGLPVSEVAVGCGFQSSSHFSLHFKEQYEATPGQYRRANL